MGILERFITTRSVQMARWHVWSLLGAVCSAQLDGCQQDVSVGPRAFPVRDIVTVPTASKPSVQTHDAAVTGRAHGFRRRGMCSDHGPEKGSVYSVLIQYRLEELSCQVEFKLFFSSFPFSGLPFPLRNLSRHSTSRLSSLEP